MPVSRRCVPCCPLRPGVGSPGPFHVPVREIPEKIKFYRREDIMKI